MNVYEKYKEMSILVNKIEKISNIIVVLNYGHEEKDRELQVAVGKRRQYKSTYLDEDLTRGLLAFFLNEKDELEKELSRFE